MKTISITMTRQMAFKKTQLLPALTPEMAFNVGGAAALRAVWPRAKSPPARLRVTPPSVSTRLPLPHVNQGPAERALFGLLALSAAVGIGQGLGLMIEMTPNWPMFNAWVERLLG